MSPLRVAVFLAVVLGVVAAIHFYLWARLVRDTQLPAPWRLSATLACVALAALAPAAAIFARRSETLPGRILAWTGFSWMGLMFLFFVLLVAADLVRLAMRAASALAVVDPADPARRGFFARVFGGAVAVIAPAMGGVSIVRARSAPVVTDVEVKLARLPAAADGLVIAQITDVHVGPTIGREFVAELVRRVNALAPDVVAITGDLVDGTVAALRDAVAPLGELRARHGVYFVTGNHELYSGSDPWVRHLASLGIRVLENQRVSVGDGAAAFDLAGIVDHSMSRGGPDQDLAQALAGRDPSRALVLLAHQPRAIHAAARAGVCLQLSGHTHGGQIWPFGAFVRLAQPYVRGLHLHRGTTQIYVSSGAGYWGPPMRLGTAPEIARVTLRRGVGAAKAV